MSSFALEVGWDADATGYPKPLMSPGPVVVRPALLLYFAASATRPPRLRSGGLVQRSTAPILRTAQPHARRVSEELS